MLAATAARPASAAAAAAASLALLQLPRGRPRLRLLGDDGRGGGASQVPAALATWWEEA